MNKQELQQLAEKYFKGTATVAEKQLLHNWYDNSNDGWAEHINTDEAETTKQVKERLLANLQERKRLMASPSSPIIKNNGRIKRLVIQALSAAAVLFIAYFIWPAGKDVVNISSTDKQMVNAPLNRIIRVILPDSSTVWLSAGSVFKYPKKFAGITRDVELLEGRAFFDVKHRVKQPFIVRTKNLNITVMGTSFDVQSYQKQGTTKVSVVTGKVGITLKNRTTKQALFLLPKQQLVLNSLNNQLIKEQTKNADANEWCKNILVFDQENLANVFAALEKKYHTHITVEDKKLLDERISITLSDQHLDTIIEILSFTKHFKYEIANDNTIVIRK